MNSHFYPPSLQRQWAEEVLYLHSLWRSSNTPSPNPNLRVIHSTHFKKPHKLKPALKEVEWPVQLAKPEPVSDFRSWPDPVLKPKPVPTAEEDKSKPDVIQLQKLAVKLSKDNFVKDDEDLSEEEDEEEEEEVNALEFFKGLFENDEKFRGCYEKYWENGEFYCLVCVGIGAKVSKTYKNCVALVQHSVTVLKTKKRAAHRGFGRAICSLLGWNFERLPSIVLDVGKCSKKEVEIKEKQKADVVQNEAICEIIELSDDVKKDDSNADFVDARKPNEHEEQNKDNQDGMNKRKKNLNDRNEGCVFSDQQLQQNCFNTCHELLVKSKDESSSDDECNDKELAT